MQLDDTLTARETPVRNARICPGAEPDKTHYVKLHPADSTLVTAASLAPDLPRRGGKRLANWEARIIIFALQTIEVTREEI